MATNIGMMDAAYFVGGWEILSWINSTLHLNLSKVEEAWSGAVHCQLMDSVHPRRNDGQHLGSLNQTNKISKSSSSSGSNASMEAERAAYEQKLTELKLSVYSLEKEREFYFAKLRDMGILCQCPEIENLHVVEAMKKFLYVIDDDGTVVAEAQAMISEVYGQTESLATIKEEEPEDLLKTDSQKRKNIRNIDVDAAATSTLSPRQKISDSSDVHHSGGSPLVTYLSVLLL